MIEALSSLATSSRPNFMRNKTRRTVYQICSCRLRAGKAKARGLKRFELLTLGLGQEKNRLRQFPATRVTNAGSCYGTAKKGRERSAIRELSSVDCLRALRNNAAEERRSDKKRRRLGLRVKVDQAHETAVPRPGLHVSGKRLHKC